MKSEWAGLATQIRISLRDVEQVVRHIEELSNKAVSSGDNVYWEAAALSLHGFYSGIERIFVDIAQVVDRVAPSSSDWHQQLVRQMAQEAPGVRPAVIRPETWKCLDEFRRFRHIVRNIYVLNLKPERVRELATDLPTCYRAASEDLNNFAELLDRLATSGDIPSTL